MGAPGFEPIDANALQGKDLREAVENGYAESYALPDEITDLAALLAEISPDDRAELLASIRTLLKFYRAGVTAESK